jgi:3-hydroxymyristoyl/3-hydroxydecanoyl-(acyl carrier protein) dehydratase
MILESLAQNSIQIRKAHTDQMANNLFILKGIKDADFFDYVLPGTTINLKSLISWDDFGKRGRAHSTAKNSSGLIANACIEFVCLSQRRK